MLGLNIFYRNNPNLRRFGTEIEYTKEQIDEYIKCSEDFEYFIDNYCKTVSLDHGLVPFILYNYQRRLLQKIHNNRFLIGKLPRQAGKTQTIVAYILWYTLFQNDKFVLILANKGTTAREVLTRYRDMYQDLPLWLQQGVEVWNKGSVELENGVTIYAQGTSADAGRGKSINLLYVDEAAFIPKEKADAFFTSVYPTISSGKESKIILTSTPYGYNHFWQFWVDAEAGRNGYVAESAHWSEHPNRDQAWADEQKGILGPVQYSQEVETSFIGSSYTLLDMSYVTKLPVLHPVYEKDNLDILIKPEKNHIYVITVDPSEGLQQDNHAFLVIDITELPYKVVAKYKDYSISPLLLPNVIERTARSYNNAYVLIEINKGEQVATILQSEIEYENILMISRKAAKGQQIGGGFGDTRPFFGLSMDKKVKKKGCDTLKALVETDQLLLNDKDLISEATTFVKHKTSYAADDGYTDDLIMCAVIFAWMTSDKFFNELSSFAIRDNMYNDQMKHIEADLVPFGFIDDGVTDYDFEQDNMKL